MLYHNVHVMAHSVRFVDALLVAVAAGTSIAHLDPAILPGSQHHASLWVFCIVLAAAFLVVAETARLYHARRTEEVFREIASLVVVLLYATSIACFVTQVLTPGLSGRAYLGGIAAAGASLVAVRVLMRVGIRHLREQGRDYRVWLLIGHNERSADLTETVLRNPHFGVRICAVADILHDMTPRALPERLTRGALAKVPKPVLADVDELRRIVEANVIDEVVVTLPVRSSYDTISRILAVCSEAGISVKMCPELFKHSGWYTEVSLIGRIPMVTHYSGPSNSLQLLLKRMIDVAGAAVGLVLLLPVLIAIGFAVRMTSPGPVFFRQTRVGLHGRHFEMIKFRSMVRDAPQLRGQFEQHNQRDGTAFKIRNDARVTPFGRWLRKYHLDELPQLWNVLVGDMSLVGPRPLPVKEANGNEWWQRRRLTMPPGLTCFWQLADDPTIPFREWMALDMAYIDRWSVWLDIKLIALTFATVARGRGW